MIKKLWEMKMPFNRSFHAKIIMSISGLILVSFIFIGFVSYRMSNNIAQEEIQKQYLKANEQTIARIELRVEEMYRMSQSIIFNSNIERLVKQLTTDIRKYDHFYNQKQLNKILNQVKVDMPYIRTMHMSNMEGTQSYSINSVMEATPLDEQVVQKIIDLLSDTSGEPVWLPHQFQDSTGDPSYYVSRKMKNTHYETYGILIMEVHPLFFAEMLTEITQEGSEVIYLFDRQKLLYSNQINRPLSYSQISDIRLLEEINGVLYASSQSNKIGMSLLTGISLKAVQQKSEQLFRVIIYAGLIIVFVALVLVTAASWKLLQPLKELVYGMRRLREGHFGQRIPVYSNDELGFLAKNFNMMSERIQLLIDEVYVRQIREKEAQLKAIQAQLNPHFLHNILNELYWKLHLQNDSSSAELISSLSEMLKYSLMPILVHTTVEKELDQIRNYLHIQKALFHPHLEVIIKIDDEVKNAEMVRSLLLPLVENVFVHAFKGKSSGEILVIHALTRRNTLIIEIHDNGCGMKADTIEKALSPTSNDVSDNSREPLGIQSVVQLIQLIYGSPYRLEISSEYGHGTLVSLILPYRVDQLTAISKEGA